MGSRAKSGFTLAEVLITVGVFGIAMAATLSFFVFALESQRADQAKLLVNRDIRAFTSELADNATFANYFVIYESFKHRNQMNDGLSGDFLALVYRDVDEPEKIARIVGYYRATQNANQEGPVQRLELNFDPASSDELEDLLPHQNTLGSHEEVIELSKGLSDGKLFYNFYDRSIMTRGEIIHRAGGDRRVTNTYNFTVSPRG